MQPATFSKKLHHFIKYGDGVIYLFVVYLYTASNDRIIVYKKGCGKKPSWPDLRYYAGICLEHLRGWS
jgi:hypothetical protein